jgi:hypothetical protein
MELEMAIFYRGPCARITHEVFERRCPPSRSFFLDELRQVHVVEWAVEPPAAVSSARIGSTSVAGAAAVAFALSQLEGWQALDSPVEKLALVALLVVSMAVTGACWRIDSVEYELAAHYRGEPVSLYRSPDAREFSQIKRGLLRALERLADET